MKIVMYINERIKTYYNELSTKQKKIASYLIQNEDDISFKTLKEISQENTVTEVTVINFCKAIGLESFSELKHQFQKQMLKKSSPTQKLFQDLTESGIKNDFFIKTIDQQLKNHQATMARLTESELERAVELITGANKIYIFCEGLSQIIGTYLKKKLDNLGIDVELVDLTHIDTRFFIKSLKFTEKDLYVCITYPIYSGMVVKLSEYYHMKGYPVIGITDKDTSPLKKYSDITFFSDNDSLVFYNSIHASISIVEVISNIIYRKLQEKLKTIKMNIEELENEFEDYMKK